MLLQAAEMLNGLGDAAEGGQLTNLSTGGLIANVVIITDCHNYDISN